MKKNVRKELNKLYNDLSFEFDGMKMINKIFKKDITEKEEKIKESTDVEKYNDVSLKFDDAKMTNKMLDKKRKENNKYEQKIQKLKEDVEESEKYINIDVKIKDEKQKGINELKNLKGIHEKEIKYLKDLKKSNQEPKSIKKSDQ